MLLSAALLAIVARGTSGWRWGRQIGARRCRVGHGWRRKCAGGISGKRLVAIFYFYAASSYTVRRERRCEKVDGGASRTTSGGGERGGVLTAARGGGKEIVKAGASSATYTMTDNTKEKE